MKIPKSSVDYGNTKNNVACTKRCQFSVEVVPKKKKRKKKNKKSRRRKRKMKNKKKKKKNRRTRKTEEQEGEDQELNYDSENLWRPRRVGWLVKSV